MRAIIQRVTKASVTVGEEVVSSIGQGICVLVGICREDTKNDIEYMVRKVLNTRLFDDDQGKRWSKSVKDKNLEILCVSQFTLYHVLKGNKPDFHNAMGGEHSENFYKEYLEELRKAYCSEKIKDGKFGAMMQVHIQNDGPVTIQLESPQNTQQGDTKKDQVRRNKKKTETKSSGMAAEAQPSTEVDQLTSQTQEKLSTSLWS